MLEEERKKKTRWVKVNAKKKGQITWKSDNNKTAREGGGREIRKNTSVERKKRKRRL